MQKIKPASLDMIVAISNLFTMLQSDADAILEIQLQGDVIYITDRHCTRLLAFAYDEGKQIVIHTRVNIDKPEATRESSYGTYNLNNMPEIEDHIIKTFGL